MTFANVNGPASAGVAKNEVKIYHLIPNELFDENKVNVLNKLLEADLVYVWSRNDVVINMSKVNFLAKDDSALMFVFDNNSRLIVYRSGEVVFVTPETPREVISLPPEPGQNWVAHNDT